MNYVCINIARFYAVNQTELTMTSEVPLVLVTGASGYIATHIVQQLLQAGHRVRGTVRSLKNEKKLEPVLDLCPGSKYPIELVEADLTIPLSWNDAVHGCSYVLHTASPNPNKNPADPMELITPAVEGTLAVLQACKDVGGVKRVVLTSSVASVVGGFDTQIKNHTFSEDDWTNVEKTKVPYVKSKTLAEKAAWKFVEQLPEEEKFELAVINPCYVMGPVLCGNMVTSMELTKRLLGYSIPALPHLNFAIVDVRDVAVAHIKAMTHVEAAGKRHILASHNLWMKEIALIYKEEFAKLGYSVPTFQAPYFLLWAYSFFDKTAKMLIPQWGVIHKYDNTRMLSVLEIKPREVKDTIIDMGYSMIQKGFIAKTEKFEETKQ